MKKLALLPITLLLLTFGYAQADKKKDNMSFEVTSVIKCENRKLKEGKLLIYKEGVLIDEMETENGKFELTLPKGSHYMLEFRNEECFTKRIALNTTTEDNEADVPVLDLTMTLIPIASNYIAEEDLDLFDFPVAYIAYDVKKKEYYDKNKTYSKIIMDDIYESEKRQLKESGLSMN
jgi:hypothetical protein